MKLHRLLGVALLAAALTHTAHAQRRTRPMARRTGSTKATSGKKHALLVVLENGGVKLNLPQKLKVPMLNTAKCGKMVLARNPGESIPKMLTRLADLVKERPECLNPAKWRSQKQTFSQWLQNASDFLLEGITTSILKLQRAREAYGRVVVMEDRNCTPDRVLAQMRSLVAKGYELDMHILTHGSKEDFIGHDEVRFNAETFFTPAKAIRGLKIRSVYQMNCVSGSLVDDWRALGAKVVNGTKITHGGTDAYNNYMPHSYFLFTKMWLKGKSFEEAVTKAYKRAAPITKLVYKLGKKGYWVDQSRHFVHGNGRITVGRKVKSLPAKVVASAGKAAKTGIEALVDTFRAAGNTAGEVAKKLRQQGKTAAEAAVILRDHFGQKAKGVAKHLKKAGYKTRKIAAALKNKMRCSLEDTAKFLRKAGCSTNAIAEALKKELKCSMQTTTNLLKKAGCKSGDIAKALIKKLGCSTKEATRRLKGAGYGFKTTAKALKKAGSGFSSILSAMTSVFSKSTTWVMAELAKLGIRR